MLTRFVQRFVLATFIALLTAGTLVAQPPGKKDKKAEEKPQASYFMPYVATFVAVGIGLAAVCLPSHRKSEVEMEEEE